MSNITNFPIIYNDPIQWRKTTKPLLISVEGNIGAGKSTLLSNLKKEFDPTIVFLQEPVDMWEAIRDSTTDETILQRFYKDPAKYAFSFQVLAYATRLSMLRKTIADNPECRVVICERSLDADNQIFAKMLQTDGMIEDLEYKIYKTFFDEFSKEFTLDGIIYLDIDPLVCHERVALRNRDGEEGISLDYLYRCREHHEIWLKDNVRVLKITDNNKESVTEIKKYIETLA
jgi:deoxyadenosine/deoxycytidine kinase